MIVEMHVVANALDKTSVIHDRGNSTNRKQTRPKCYWAVDCLHFVYRDKKDTVDCIHFANRDKKDTVFMRNGVSTVLMLPDKHLIIWFNGKDICLYISFMA